MREAGAMRVLGVDACKGGWVGVCLDEAIGSPLARCESTIASLVQSFGALECVAIDIPIGLPTSAPRLADRLARSAVGRRSSSVFTTPPRSVLAAATHAEASALCRELCGFGISQQAFALRTKIFEVDEWAATTDHRVVEVHPEVSFATLAGQALMDPKSTWSGFDFRRRLLADAGIALEGDLGLTGKRVAADDVLDAAVAAWSARRVASGEHVSLPDPAEVLDDGCTACICA